MKLRQYLRFAVLLSVIGSLAAQGAESRRDGNWWRHLPELERLAYVVGFFDGMGLGHEFSYWGLPSKDGKVDSFTEAVGVSYALMEEKYLKGVTNNQIADGITKLYADYRNRTIMLHGAVWLVLNSI